MDCGVHGLGTPREHHIQLLLPAPLEAQFRSIEGLEALRRSARDHPRTVGDVQETIGIGNQLQADRLAGIQRGGEICFAVAAQDADAHAEA